MYIILEIFFHSVNEIGLKVISALVLRSDQMDEVR